MADVKTEVTIGPFIFEWDGWEMFVSTEDEHLATCEGVSERIWKAFVRTVG